MGYESPASGYHQLINGGRRGERLIISPLPSVINILFITCKVNNFRKITCGKDAEKPVEEWREKNGYLFCIIHNWQRI